MNPSQLTEISVHVVLPNVKTTDIFEDVFSTVLK